MLAIRYTVSFRLYLLLGFTLHIFIRFIFEYIKYLYVKS